MNQHNRAILLLNLHDALQSNRRNRRKNNSPRCRHKTDYRTDNACCHRQIQYDIVIFADADISNVSVSEQLFNLGNDIVRCCS